MNFFSKWIILLMLAVIGINPIPSKAAGLDQKIEGMFKNFEQQIKMIDSGKAYFIVVRSFVDKHTQRPSKRSEEITDIFFTIIRDRHFGKSKVVILNWRAEAPLEIKDPNRADEIYYRLGVWGKLLLESYGKGFLITGASGVNEELLVISAELIDMATGKVLTVSKEALPKGADDLAQTKETKPSQPLAADKVDAAKAPVPAGIKEKAEEQEKVLKDLEYKVIEGVNFKYEGYMQNGKKYGQGTLSYQSGDKYVGEWENDKKHGHGTYSYADGDKYVGEWKNGNMHGQGTYFFKSGNKYVGGWENDKKHGHGTYYFKNGDKWEGAYVNNKKHGRGVYTWAGGQPQEELWKDGQLVK
ncbi:MAG: hypothetical protein KKH68_10790 [Proteobacteria bacterium]|nr:hypothetical protein [Pseudomonadota bacterium]